MQLHVAVKMSWSKAMREARLCTCVRERERERGRESEGGREGERERERLNPTSHPIVSAKLTEVYRNASMSTFEESAKPTEA